jgi:hypothetical protein
VAQHWTAALVVVFLAVVVATTGLASRTRRPEPT